MKLPSLPGLSASTCAANAAEPPARALGEGERPGNHARERPATKPRNGLLEGFRRLVRPAAISVTIAPGYTRTTIDPLPPSTLPEGKPSPGGHRRAAAASAQTGIGRWIAKRTQALPYKLHPPSAPAPPPRAAEAPDAEQAMLSESAFVATVAKLFPDGLEAPSAASSAVTELAAGFAHAADARPTEAPPAHYAGVLQCARALAAATQGDAARAVRALRHLQHHALLGFLGNGDRRTGTPRAHDAAAVDSAAERDAWHAARILSHTTVGFDALVALRDDETLSSATVDGAMKRESLRTFLQAADHLAAHVREEAAAHRGASVPREASAPASAACPDDAASPSDTSGPRGAAMSDSPDSSDSPEAAWHEALRRLAVGHAGPDSRDTMALNALACAAKVYAAPHASAQAIGDGAQLAAYVAWRSGYRESGAGSALARTQSRIAKFLTWVARSERRATHRRHAFDPRRALGQRKSPLTAMTYNAAGANLGLVSREAQSLRDAVDTALAGVLDHLQACRQRGHLSPEQRGVLLLREQYLKRWRASVGELRNPTRLKLSHRDRDTIATAVRVLAPRAGLQAHAVLAARMVSDLKHLDLRTLEAWLHEAGMPGPRPDEAGDALPAIRLAAAIARGRPIKPADTTHSAFREALRDIVAKTPLGNNVRYFDGGTWGLNVNTSLNMRDFTVHKAGLGVSLGPGIKALQGRHAFLEIGSSSYGGEIFMGTDTRYSTGAAIGLFGGAAVGVHGLHFAFGAGGGVAYSHDRSAPSGVIVRTRLRRDEGGKVTDSWRTHASAVIDFLYEQGALAASARRPSAETLWERFSERFFREPDISVNWREQRRSSHTVSENAGIMARLALSGLRIGPALNATRDTLLAGKNERIDANGWLRGVERTRTRSRALTGSAALVGAVASAGHFSGHAGYPESVSIPSVPIVGAMSTFAPHGASVVLRIVDEHGRLNAKYIRSLVEFVDPRAFAAHVERRRGQIARTDGSNARLDAFLREVKACAIRGNQAYGESLKIRPDVADTLSAYEAEIETLARCANGSPRGAERDEIARLRQRIGDLLADPQSWKVSGYYTYEINTRGYAAGPAMIVQATAATSTAGERVLAELAVSELEALDDPVGAAHGDADGVH